ncbi:hypothetical protein FRC09_002329 [Ceratobasidium sp. 395]|nr:hypothetical protein FRC09_002329 [Ceratobasidium sp. 395]
MATSEIPVTTQEGGKAKGSIRGQAAVADPENQAKVEDTGDQGTIYAPGTSRESQDQHVNDGGLEELRLQIYKLSVSKDENESRPIKEVPGSKALPSRGIAGPASSNPTTGSSSRSKGFTLSPQHANMLLLNRVYFVVFPTIYVFDQHGIVCCIDPTNDHYHEVDLRPSPNPPGSESVFQLSGITYWFDRTNQLWYNLEGQWYMETTYLDLTAARHEVARCAEQNRLPAPPIGGPSGVTSPATTVTNSPYQDSTDDDYLYQPLSSRPSQDEIDQWMVEFKARRNALLKTRERLGDIRCPLEECRKPQRRPQALRDHLYFHFGIKRESVHAQPSPIMH